MEKDIVKYAIYNLMTIIAFCFIGLLISLLMNNALYMGGLFDNLISIIIVSFILMIFIFLSSLVTKNPLLRISLAYMLYSTCLYFLYNRAMEVADLVWESFSYDFKLGYILFYIFDKQWEALSQNIWLFFYITIQGIISGIVFQFIFGRARSRLTR